MLFLHNFNVLQVVVTLVLPRFYLSKYFLMNQLFYRIYDYPYSQCWQYRLTKHRLNRSDKNKKMAVAFYHREQHEGES